MRVFHLIICILTGPLGIHRFFKGYKFKDINDFLLQNNFKQIFKIKMPLRKTFEYIYKNKAY